MVPKLNQLFAPLYESAARYFFLYGGRGSSKSFHAADFLLKLTYQKGHKILYTRYTMKSAKKSVIPEFADKIQRYKCSEHFEITNEEITNLKTGSKILFAGIKTSEGIQTAALKSIPDVTTWVLDEAEELPSEAIFNTIDESIRLPNIQNRVILILNPTFVTHWIYDTFFKDLPEGFAGRMGTAPIDREYIYSSYLDNADHLAESFIAKADLTKATDILGYNNRYLGHWASENPNALWKREEIKYEKAPEEFARVVVAIDPATTSNTKSDETGIVVAGKTAAGKIYVLEDATGKYKPEEWAQKSVNLYYKWGASVIVPETNQGGDMVKNTIYQIDETVNVKGKHAVNSKKARAEPVKGLYSKGIVFHAQKFAKLEQEMLTWSGLAGDKSPNRLDAMVWGVAELGLRTFVVT